MANTDTSALSSAVTETATRSLARQSIDRSGQDVQVEKTEYVEVESRDRSERSNNALELTDQTISPQRLADLVEKLREAIPPTENGLEFRIDEILGRPIVSVIDQASGEIIRQLPSDEVVRAAHNIEYMRGVLFDSRS